MSYRTAAISGLVSVLAVTAGCSSSPEPVATEGAATVSSAVVQGQGDEAAQSLAGLVAMVLSMDETGALLDDTITKDETDQKGCYESTTTLNPLRVTIELTGAEGCLASQGTITLERIGEAGSKLVLATIGSSSVPVKVSSLLAYGHLTFDRLGAGEVAFATANDKGTAYEAACDADEPRCLAGCLVEQEGQTSCSEPATRVGVLGTADLSVLGGDMEVEALLSGAGSAWVARADLSTTQAIVFGAPDGATDVCPSAGWSTPEPLRYVVPLENPPSLSCACPTSGTASSSGQIEIAAGVDCPSDPDADANFDVSIIVDDAAIEYEFVGTCGVDVAASCGTSSARVLYQNVNMKACGLPTCGQVVRTLLGCNADCTSCTTPQNGIDTGDLAGAGTFGQSLAAALADAAAELPTLFEEAMSEICNVPAAP